MQIFIFKDGQQSGPFSLSDVNNKVVRGELLPDDFAWQEGMPDWVPLSQIPSVDFNRQSGQMEQSVATPAPTNLKYYKVDSRRIGWGEYIDLAAGNPASLCIVWICKLLKLQMNLSDGLPEPQPIKSLVIESSAFSPEVKAWFDDVESQLSAFGFKRRHYLTLKHSLLPLDTYLVDLSDAAGEIHCRAVYARSLPPHPPKINRYIMFMTVLSNSTYLGTSNLFGSMSNPPAFKNEKLKTESAEKLYRLHSTRLEKIRPSTPPLAFAPTDRYYELLDEVERVNHEFHINRGVYVEMSPEEVETLRQIRGKN